MEKYITDSKIINELYDMFGKLIDILNKNNINYFVDGGSLLGAVRHQSIIPWDDDIDISIIENEKTKYFLENDIKSILNQINMDIIKITGCYKIFNKNGKKIKRNKWKYYCREIKKKFKLNTRKEVFIEASKTYNKNDIEDYYEYTFPSIDIFMMFEENDKIKYIPYGNSWDNFYYLKNDLYPLKIYNFGNLNVTGPNKPHNYLSMNYGDKYMTEAYIDYDHEKETKIKKIKIKL